MPAESLTVSHDPKDSYTFNRRRGESVDAFHERIASSMERAAGHGVPPRLVRLPEVCRRTGLARSSIYRLLAAGTFPRPVAVTRVARAWRLEDVDRWIDALGADPLSSASPEHSNAPTGGAVEASHS